MLPNKATQSVRWSRWWSWHGRTISVKHDPAPSSCCRWARKYLQSLQVSCSKCKHFLRDKHNGTFQIHHHYSWKCPGIDPSPLLCAVRSLGLEVLLPWWTRLADHQTSRSIFAPQIIVQPWQRSQADTHADRWDWFYYLDHWHDTIFGGNPWHRFNWYQVTFPPNPFPTLQNGHFPTFWWVIFPPSLPSVVYHFPTLPRPSEKIG